MKRWFPVGVTVFLIVFFASFVAAGWSKYTTPYNLDYWQQEFSISQIVLGNKARHFFSDSELYAILGYKYVTGQDPAKMHAEVPPLGKLIQGWGIVTFGNEKIANLILGLGTVVLVGLLAFQVTGSHAASAASALLYALNSQFLELLSDSNIDIPMVFFLLLSQIAFLKGLRRPKWFILASLSMGWLMATKFYFNGLILFGVNSLALLLYQQFKSFVAYIASLPLVLAGFAMPYAQTFYHDPNPYHFIQLQSWITGWWAGNARVPWGRIFPMLFVGKWYTWWKGPPVIPITYWDFTWPLLAITGILGGMKSVLSRNLGVGYLFLWVGAFVGFLSFTSPFPRYLVAVFPYLIILTVYLFTHRRHETAD